MVKSMLTKTATGQIILPPLARSEVYRLMALLVLAALVYYPLLHAGFIWDDDLHFVDDNFQLSLHGLYRIWFDPEKSVWNYWPLSRTSFWIERRVWGLNPAGYHLDNILLHLASVIVLFFILRRLRTAGIWFSVALFAVHPVMMESVAWITERKNTLSMLFYLLSILAFLRYYQCSAQESSAKYYYLSCAGFVVALLCKSSIIMMPVLLVLVLWCLEGKLPITHYKKIVPYLLIALAFGLLNIYFEDHYIGSSGERFDRGVLDRLAVAGLIPLFYLKNILAPLQLSFFYPKWQVDVADPIWYLPLLSLTVCVAVLVIAVVRTRNPSAHITLCCLGAYLVSLFPVLGFFDVYGMRFSYVSDHWCYVPAIPVFVWLGMAGSQVTRSLQAPIRNTIVIALVLFCAFLSWAQTPKYMSRTGLWLDTLRYNPDAQIVHNNLAVEYNRAGNWESALQHADRAIALDPKGSAESWTNRSIALWQLQRYNEALQSIETARQLLPNNFTVYHIFGVFSSYSGHYPQALQLLTRALQIRDDYAATYFERARVYEALGQISLALADVEQALRLQPDNAEYRQVQSRLGALNDNHEAP